MKHTPGPWEVSENGNGDLDVCLADGGDMVADLKGCPNAEANARLIAAAPELLEAAQKVESAIQGLELDPTLKSATDRLYVAIAKAEGTVQS